MNWHLTPYNDGVKLVNKPNSVVLKLGEQGHLNSIYTETTVRLGQLIGINYNVTTLSGKPRFVSIDAGAPANFSPMIAKNTALDGRWYIAGDPTDRCIELQPALDAGELWEAFTLNPRYWQDVNGKQSEAGFKKGVSEARILEIVFGGKFRAHGIQVQGGRVKIELEVTV